MKCPCDLIEVFCFHFLKNKINNSSSGSEIEKKPQKRKMKSDDGGWVVVHLSSEELSPRSSEPSFRVMGCFQQKSMALKFRETLRERFPGITSQLLRTGQWGVVVRHLAHLGDSLYKDTQVDQVLGAWSRYLDWERGDEKKDDDDDDSFDLDKILLITSHPTNEDTLKESKLPPENKKKQGVQLGVKEKKWVRDQIEEISDGLEDKIKFAVVVMVPDLRVDRRDQLKKQEPVFCVLRGFREEKEAKSWTREKGKEVVPLSFQLFVVPCCQWIRPSLWVHTLRLENLAPGQVEWKKKSQNEWFTRQLNFQTPEYLAEVQRVLE